MTKKTKKTTSKKQIVVAQKRYINSETNEVETFNVVDQYDQDFNFDKLWLGHILDSLDVIGNQKIKVLNWLLANKDTQNQIIGTQRIIAEKTNVSVPTVNQTIQMLERSNLLKKVQTGVYLLNPEIVFKGSHQKRMSILLRYTKTDTIEHKNELEDFSEEQEQEEITKKEDKNEE